MAGFQFRLESLLSYRQHLRDLSRQRLGQVMSVMNELKSQADQVALQQQLEMEKLNELVQPGRLNLDLMSTRRTQLSTLAVQLTSNQQQQEQMSEVLQKAQEQLTQADQAVKVLEKLKEKEQQKFLDSQQAREQRELEEIWMASHGRETFGESLSTEENHS